MNFDSVIFLSIFLPALLALYWLIPGVKAKNILLLLFSLLFYSLDNLSVTVSDIAHRHTRHEVVVSLTLGGVEEYTLGTLHLNQHWRRRGLAHIR